MDFTIDTYRKLIETFVKNDYTILTYEKYCQDKTNYDQTTQKIVILRHDVDEIANNALKMAQVEHQLGIQATYYFRIVKQSNRPDIIRKIADMGHEIGYHYEDLALVGGDMEKAKQTFEKNLTYFRTYYPVKTVCMHGSSTSQYDNRTFWQSYQLQEFDLIGEPYLTTDFDQFYYLTDTGYAWDGDKYNVSDKVNNHNFSQSYHASKEIISALKKEQFPQKVLILAHTLWSDSLWQWTALHLREYIRNNLKYMAQHNQVVHRFYQKIVKLYWRK